LLEQEEDKQEGKTSCTHEFSATCIQEVILRHNINSHGWYKSRILFAEKDYNYILLCSVNEQREEVVSDITSAYGDTIVISTQRLTKAFGNLVAVNDLNLQVMRGDVFGFLGPNGSGKTTTIRMLLGLIHPTAGRAVLFGMDNAYQLPSILQRIGAIVETPTFYPYLSGIDNLRVIAANSGMVLGKANHQRYEEVLDIVELRQYQKLIYSKYSLGMKQRLGIAAALLSDPELVMLDEPTNGLDPAGVIEIRKLIQRLAGLGKTIFLSSHILFEVQQVCNRVAILRKGNLVRQGDVKELLREKEQVEIRMNQDEEVQVAYTLLQQYKEQGADWITNIALEQNARRQAVLLIDAPNARSSEINKLLAHNNLFAAEVHPLEGSLEAVYLQATALPNRGTRPTAVDNLDTISTADPSAKGVR
jgi:ABC-2 type transport system ATP-binding protein